MGRFAGTMVMTSGRETIFRGELLDGRFGAIRNPLVTLRGERGTERKKKRNERGPSEVGVYICSARFDFRSNRSVGSHNGRNRTDSD